MRKAFHKLTLIFVVVVTGCSEIVGFGDPLEFAGAVSYFDEPMFRRLWDELKACSKLSGSLRSIGFYYVPGESLPTTLHGIRTIGMYFPGTNRIFIIEPEKWNPSVIRHEMMHALLKDMSGHPPEYFGAEGLCGHI